MPSRPADRATPGDLAAVVRDPAADPSAVHDALSALLERDPVRGSALAFGLLAGQPRIKPTRGLVIDPGDSAHRRWSCRVAAAAALLGARDAGRWADEVGDELSDDPDLAADVEALVRRAAAARA